MYQVPSECSPSRQLHWLGLRPQQYYYRYTCIISFLYNWLDLVSDVFIQTMHYDDKIKLLHVSIISLEFFVITDWDGGNESQNGIGPQLSVCLEFFVPLENFSLIWRLHHCLWKAANFDLCSTLMFIIRATPTVIRDIRL